MAKKRAQDESDHGPVPDGYRQISTRPMQIELSAGLELSGRLGAVTESKTVGMPAYRTLTTDDGRYYLPSHAALSVLMELPVGTEVWLRFDGGDGTKQAPYEWTVALKDHGGQRTDKTGDVPF